MRLRLLYLVGVLALTGAAHASCATGTTLGGVGGGGEGGALTGAGGSGTGPSGPGPAGPGSSTGGSVTCDLDEHEPNDACASAADAGSVADDTTTALQIRGTLTTGTDEDWYEVATVDAPQATGNSYHVRIRFSASTSKSEFSFDVLRGGGLCAMDATHSDLKEYDWCVDGSSMLGGEPIGEATCGAPMGAACTDHSKTYLLRVHRDKGYSQAGSCDEYVLEVTAKGGECDFTAACDPQTTE